MKHSASRKGFKRAITSLLAVACVVAASTGALAANKLIVQDATGTVDKFVVTDTGYIGVGTTTPMSGLHLKGADAASTQFVNQYEGNPSSPGTGGGGFIGYHNNPGGALPNAGDRIGYFLFGSFNGATALNSAGINARAEATWTASPKFIPSYFAFDTTEVADRTEKMRITGAGNVGIGTTAPAQKLEVNGGVRLYPSTAKPTCDNTNGPNIRGTIFFKTVALPGADTLEVCSRGADGNYAWRNLIGP